MKINMSNKFQFYNYFSSNKKAFAASCIAGLITGTLLYCDFKTQKYWGKIHSQSSDLNLKNLKNRKCVVFIESATDYNGALSFSRSVTNLQAIENHGLSVIFRKARSPEEAVKILSTIIQNQNEISTLVLAGHGNSAYIKCGNGYINANHLSLNLSKNSYIVLFSCSTANENNSQQSNSLARKVSKLNPKSIVIASNEDIIASSLQTDLTFKFIQKERNIVPIPITTFSSFTGRNSAIAFQNGQYYPLPS